MDVLCIAVTAPAWVSCVDQVGRVVIGRGKHCDVVINSGKVSREHVYVTSENGVLFAADSGSTGGTWIESARTRAVKVQVDDGLRLLLGSERVTFTLISLERYAAGASAAPSWPVLPLLGHLPPGVDQGHVEAMYRHGAARRSSDLALARTVRPGYAKAFVAGVSSSTAPWAVLAQQVLDDDTEEACARYQAMLARLELLSNLALSAAEEAQLVARARKDELMMQLAVVLAGLVTGRPGERIEALARGTELAP